jgi:hypothetical protein
MLRRAILPIFAMATLTVTGCGNSSTVAPVTGRITCHGQPVVNAVIIVSPLPKSDDDNEPGKAGSASTDDNGNYVVTTYRKDDGAHIGEVRIAITIDASIPCSCTSKIYGREVRQGNNVLNFDLGNDQ